ncbi:MAG: bifunctional 3-deoxy-7-phosphoheptulonate synthase/chorismate mutase type II [Bacteroidales bacterium]|nr:bifunctional 3-deoxy-7-phosphoheptulonate synthase/chorismate mutase type II [Bacteroidales bacterium]
MKIDSIKTWGVEVHRPLIMAGPCSAESEEQVMETARGLKEQGIQIFRAGIWKPRTRPNCFEGVGFEGLQWLKHVKQETGMLTATEVACQKHVNEALKMGVDILWIGARTSVNPFAVQEIADELKGVDIPVLIKNPINPDLELWIGAFERIAGAGITKLGAIHRGFSSFEKIKYRNAPQWQLALELHRRLPELPIICDPSHMAGKREYIKELSQKALDLGVNGLMIESHCNPDVALSDSKQQFTPSDLGNLLKELVIRHKDTDNADYNEVMSELRAKIDVLDDMLLDTLQKRMNICREIGQTKKDNNIQVFQSERWDKILTDMQTRGAEKGLSNELIEKTFKAIHQESINIQTEIVNS